MENQTQHPLGFFWLLCHLVSHIIEEAVPGANQTLFQEKIDSLTFSREISSSMGPSMNLNLPLVKNFGTVCENKILSLFLE